MILSVDVQSDPKGEHLDANVSTDNAHFSLKQFRYSQVQQKSYHLHVHSPKIL